MLRLPSTFRILWQTYPQLSDIKTDISVRVKIFNASDVLLSKETIELKSAITGNDVVILDDFEKACQYYNVNTNNSDKPGWKVIKSFNKSILGKLEAVKAYAVIGQRKLKQRISY